MFTMSIFSGVFVQSPNQPNHCERVPFPPFRLFWHHSFLMSTMGAWAFQQKWNVLTPQPHTWPREAGWGTRHCRAPLSGPNLCWALTIFSTERKNCLMSTPKIGWIWKQYLNCKYWWIITFNQKLTLVSETFCSPSREGMRETTAAFPTEQVAKGYDWCSYRSDSQQIGKQTYFVYY